MQTKKLVLATFVIGNLVGCNFKTTDKSDIQTPTTVAPATTKANTDASFKETLKTIEKGTKALAEGKAQGLLLVAGVIADGSAPKSDQILVPKDPAMVEARDMSKEELDVMNNVTSKDTFINIGCNNIPQDEIKGLKQIKATIDNKSDFFHAHARRVFICGTGQVERKNAVVYAEEVYMTNTNFVFKRGNGLVNICAKTLVLQGQNNLTTIESPKNPGNPGSPVFLSVLEGIEGSGQLHINDKQ